MSLLSYNEDYILASNTFWYCIDLFLQWKWTVAQKHLKDSVLKDHGVKFGFIYDLYTGKSWTYSP